MALGPVDPLLVLAVVTLAAWTAAAGGVARGIRRLTRLLEVSPLEPGALPSLTVVVPARNEEEEIESSLRSLLRQDYEGLEVVAVDDRSEDATGRILDALADAHPALRVLHVEELPPGWLGKGHALQRGAESASGELLLFVDADVKMRRSDVLRRAVTTLVRRDLDHVTAIPDLETPGPLLDAVTGTFKLLFGIYFRPWRAEDPAADEYVGTGAFNLVRTARYRDAGGHRPIALQPDDDLMLGRLLKESGCRQAAVLGRAMLSVRWYAHLPELVRGLEKNSFAVADYSLLRVTAGTAGLLLFITWPGLALFLTGGATLWLNAATLAVMTLIYADNARAYGNSPVYGPLLPLTALVMVFIGWRSALLATATGEIRWRGTSYSLEELRRERT